MPIKIIRDSTDTCSATGSDTICLSPAKEAPRAADTGILAAGSFENTMLMLKGTIPSRSNDGTITSCANTTIKLSGARDHDHQFRWPDRGKRFHPVKARI